ncbi:MAG TPA: galactose mutarotase [Candidatus Levilactobacillus faecigallinarum]|uniref:Maltose epimerase n=1 Tax=Candidatus Levilactobacillus faecigallinarum TaxID=2838638 RepID=A0A9D1U4T9_9LACO|nr:galactose mutarotase [Candidatus Levilactobacillus faecigallinarum]
MQITQEAAGELHQQKVTKITLTNDHDTRVSILTWAATIQEFSVLEDGVRRQLVVRETDLTKYDPNTYCLCQALGRVAGRIAGAQFDLDGRTIHLDANEEPNAIHGGPHGFTFANWEATTKQTADTVSVSLTHTVSEAEDKYPGTLATTITYTLDNQDQLSIAFTGKSDAATLFNPTIHTYFNVTDDQHDLQTQWLKLNSQQRLVLNDQKIPTGEKAAVAGTGFDFREPRTIKDGLAELAKQNVVEYDDAFEVTPSQTTPIATVGDTAGHREVRVYSDRNGVVVFTANATDPKRAAVRDYNALALEAQNLPDAIHHPDFGDIVLPANQAVTHTIRYQYVRK